MSRPTIIAANWKMHKSRAEALEYLDELATWMQEQEAAEQQGVPAPGDVRIVVAPPFTLLDLAVEARPAHTAVFAQNMHQAASGAFTGEISPTMLRDLGVDGVILGHSERRQHFNETDEALAEKVAAAVEHRIAPILCVGETLEQRQGGRAEHVVSAQLETAVRHITAEQAVSSRLSIAYEPVWAIGTGETATPETAQQMHVAIRTRLADVFGEEVARDIAVLYGGSVKPANANELLDQVDIDGALVGGAALEVDSFTGIISAASQVAGGVAR